jgi:Protein  of unknown function (DUF3018)
MAAMSGAERSRTYRERLRSRGLREIRLIVPDARDPKLREELRRDVRALKGHPSNREGEEFVEAALADIEGWTAP